ncbi:hypothetical protein ONZ45_g6759 [Pleurotus djamor]|nr:hypothetical protein ONZ45_g6759 [Pleurotus djamor]
MVEHVILDFFLFKANVGDITAVTPTSLPHLSSFSLWCYFPSFPINFFDFINFPESAIIKFICNGGEPSATDLAGLRDFLVRFSTQRDTSITQVSISGDDELELAVLTDQSAPEPHITISLPTALPENNVEDYMNVYAALPLSTVPSLVLDSLSCCFPPGYNFLQPFHAVEVVKISRCTQHMFDNLKPIAGVIPLPNLRMIIMSECDARDDIFLELVKFLENRLPHSEADGLEKICIEGCDIADEQVIERLQAFCEVEWDGLTSATDVWEPSSSDESEGSDWSDSSEGSLASGDAYTRSKREYNISDVNLEPH